MAEGDEVAVYDNLSSGKKEFIKQHVGKGNFKLIKADLLYLDKVKGTIGRHDVVFHFAANPEARWGIENTELDLQQGTIATYSLLEVMRLNKVKKLVFASGGTVYGKDTKAVSEDAGPLLPDILKGFLTNPRFPGAVFGLQASFYLAWLLAIPGVLFIPEGRI